MKRVLMILPIMLLANCESAQYYSDAGIRMAKSAKDNEAKILLQTPCAIGGGAYIRLPVDKQRLVHEYWTKICP